MKFLTGSTFQWSRRGLALWLLAAGLGAVANAETLDLDGRASIALSATALARIDTISVPAGTTRVRIVASNNSCIFPVDNDAHLIPISPTLCPAFYAWAGTSFGVERAYPQGGVEKTETTTLVLSSPVVSGTVLVGQDLGVELLPSDLRLPGAFRIGAGAWYPARVGQQGISPETMPGQQAWAAWLPSPNPQGLVVRARVGVDEWEWNLNHELQQAGPKYSAVGPGVLPWKPGGPYTLSTSFMLDFTVGGLPDDLGPLVLTVSARDGTGRDAANCSAILAPGETLTLSEGSAACPAVSEAVSSHLSEDHASIQIGVKCQSVSNPTKMRCAQLSSMTLAARPWNAKTAPPALELVAVNGSQLILPGLTGSKRPTAFRVGPNGQSKWLQATIEADGRLVASTSAGQAALVALKGGDQLQIRVGEASNLRQEAAFAIKLKAPALATAVANNLLEVDGQRHEWTVDEVTLAGDQLAIKLPAANDRLSISFQDKTTCTSDGAPIQRGGCPSLFALGQEPASISLNGNELGTIRLRTASRSTTQSVARDGAGKKSFKPDPRGLLSLGISPNAHVVGRPEGGVWLQGGALQEAWARWAVSDQAGQDFELRAPLDVVAEEWTFTHGEGFEWCKAEPALPDLWRGGRETNFLVCFDDTRPDLGAYLPTGVPLVLPNQPIAVIVRATGTAGVKVTATGTGTLSGGTQGEDGKVESLSSPQPPVSPEERGIVEGTLAHRATWLAPRKPGEPFIVTVQVGEGTTMRTGSAQLIVRPVYSSAIRTGVAVGIVPARRSISVNDGALTVDRPIVSPEVVVGYSTMLGKGPHEDVYPPLLPPRFANMWGAYIGLGVLGAGDVTPIQFLNAAYVGIEWAPRPAATVVAAFTLHRAKQLRDGYAPGDTATVASATRDAALPGFAIIVNTSPSFLRFAKSFGYKLAKDDPQADSQNEGTK